MTEFSRCEAELTMAYPKALNRVCNTVGKANLAGYLGGGTAEHEPRKPKRPIGLQNDGTIDRLIMVRTANS